jgi:hypothetical protein
MHRTKNRYVFKTGIHIFLMFINRECYSFTDMFKCFTGNEERQQKLFRKRNGRISCCGHMDHKRSELLIHDFSFIYLSYMQVFSYTNHRHNIRIDPIGRLLPGSLVDRAYAELDSVR